MKKRLLLILVALSLTALHAFFYNSKWGEQLEVGALDLWFHLRGPRTAPEDVILIAMDEDSYQELDIPMDKAWPRHFHAKLLRRLAKAGARRAVFDVLFLGPSDDSEADKELAAALAELPTVIGADYGVSVGAFETHQLLLPYEPFRTQVESVALVGFPEDAGVVRRFKTSRTGLTHPYPSLAESGAGYSTPVFPPTPRDFISYYGPAGAIPTYSYYEVLDEELVWDEELSGKTVYIGLIMRTALGPAQKDSFVTPFWREGRTFGVEIHATAAANLITGNWITRATRDQELLYLSSFLFLACYLLLAISPLIGLLLLLVSLAGWAAISYGAFLNYSIFVPGVLLSTIFLPAIFLLSTLIYYFATYRSQKRTQKAFEHYLSPHMAREASKNPALLQLGGQKMSATALFTDIANFTTISESMSAEEVSRMLNTYFTEVMDVVFENDGTLIKFIGDAIFAVWGAPKVIPNHAEQALKSAIQISHRVEIFNATGEFPSLHTRIGLHKGDMLIGNLGSARRFDYTAVGDSVNLAARLESLNKYFGTSILFSEEVKLSLEKNFRFTCIGAVKVVGKNESVKIYTILPDSLDAIWDKTWNWALEAFQSRDWENARELFTQISQAENFLSASATFYLAQVEERVRYAPEPEWSGEISFLTK